MASDARLNFLNQSVLLFDGTGIGADTCCLLSSVSFQFFEILRIQAIYAVLK